MSRGHQHDSGEKPREKVVNANVDLKREIKKSQFIIGKQKTLSSKNYLQDEK